PRRDAGTPSVPGSKDDDLARLRTYGIRTATDLIRAFAEAKNRSGAEEQLLGLLGNASGTPGLSRLGCILNTLTDDDWVGWLRLWNSRTALGQGKCYLQDIYTYPDELALNGSVQPTSEQTIVQQDRGAQPTGASAGGAQVAGTPSNGLGLI